MDTGPFFSGTIQTPGVFTPKGLVIRVGENGEGALCYDTELMRVSAGWTGGFLAIDPARYGIITPPKPAGDIQFASPLMPGFAKNGSFADVRTHKPWGPLPHDWAHYKGLYLQGKRVVLNYTVGDAEVLESPWMESNGDLHIFSRTFEFRASRDELKMVVCDTNGRAAAVLSDRSVISCASVKQKETKDTKIVQQERKPNSSSFPSLASVRKQIELITDGKSPVVLRVAPHAEPVRLKLLVWSVDDKRPEEIQTIVTNSAAPENLNSVKRADKPRWAADITTRGVLSADKKSPYVIDTLTLPFDNPYKALMFASGHDFFSNGDAAVCTLHGDVWIVSGIDEKLQRLTWKRFATGLFQPLGMKIVEDQIYVVGRDQITRLHDRNNDGEADFYENFNNEGHTSFVGHEYVTCLETDSQGNFYYVKGNGSATSAHHGCLLRVSKDGSKLDVVATGFRNPNGMSIGPNDEITVSPQEGEWTPASSILWVKPGGFYGFVPSAHQNKPPTGYDPPLCWLPRLHDNSSGGQVWVNSDCWGPLNGQLLHFSFGQSKMMLVLREEVDGTMQGGTINFPLNFDSGVMRGRFRPQDGQLYVTGLKGWVSNAVKDGCFQRVRYTRSRLEMPVGIRTLRNGIAITFSQPIDHDSAEDPDNFNVEQWNYRWSQTYGSPEYKVSNPKEEGRNSVEVESATLLDARTVFLEIKNLQPVMQMGIAYTLDSAAGTQLRQQVYLTINKVGRETIPTENLTRHARRGRLPEVLRSRLQPGVLVTFRDRSGDRIRDSLRQRMLSFVNTGHSTPSPFIRVMDRMTAEYTGFLNVPLKGDYRFQFEGTGQVDFEVNGHAAFDSKFVDISKPGEFVTTLHKGFNRFRLRYQFDPKHQEFRAYWQSDSFPREPIPPTVLFCDGGDPGLQASDKFRKGRELFSTRKCIACHVDLPGRVFRPHFSSAMLEIYDTAPILDDIGVRINREWVIQWLLNPKFVRNHVTMPSLLGNGNKQHDRQHALDLAAYLMTLQKYIPPDHSVSGQKITVIETRATTQTGEELYENLGCIACHRFTPPHDDDEYDRVSLYFANAKFRPQALRSFLEKPEARHPGTRMPNFRLNPSEVDRLTAFVRQQSRGMIDSSPRMGNATQGKRLYETLKCGACHFVNRSETIAIQALDRGCLADSVNVTVPNFDLIDAERDAIRHFLRTDPQYKTLFRNDAESTARLIRRLNCVACHDRDHQRSNRRIILAEEGSDGLIGPPLPNLTWSGEKLKTRWTHRLFSGQLKERARPWLKERMPAFPGHAALLANGLSAQHGWPSKSELKSVRLDPSLAEAGRRLTLKNDGFDCRQCHAIGNLKPTGDKSTKIAPGINFSETRDRLRYGYYRRFMLDPPRYDVGLKMPKLSADGKTTKIRNVFDGDAGNQFDAMWHYIQTIDEK